MLHEVEARLGERDKRIELASLHATTGVGAPDGDCEAALLLRHLRPGRLGHPRPHAAACALQSGGPKLNPVGAPRRAATGGELGLVVIVT